MARRSLCSRRTAEGAFAIGLRGPHAHWRLRFLVTGSRGYLMPSERSGRPASSSVTAQSMVADFVCELWHTARHSLAYGCHRWH